MGGDTTIFEHKDGIQKPMQANELEYKLQIGDAAPDFQDLPATDGDTYSLSDFKEAPVLMVVFSCNHCPYVKAYEARMNAVFNDYHDDSVAMIAINSNDVEQYPDDSLEAMKARADEQGFGFVYAFDESQDVARAYGALCTPHVFIFDRDRRLAYQGAYDQNKDDEEAGNAQDVRNALDALVAGRTPEVPITRAFGCSIKWKPDHFTELKT